MSKFKETATKVKDHVKRNDVRYAVVIGMSLILVTNYRNAMKFDKFMTEKGIDPREFWLTPEDFASIKDVKE